MQIKNCPKIISCPDCEENIKEIKANKKLLGFYCSKCELIYPIKEEILILLPSKLRNYNLEYELVKKIEGKKYSKAKKNTLNVIEKNKNSKSWEWEDEEYWGKEYKEEIKTSSQKNWNDRIWQREFLIKSLLNKTDLNRKKILDVGCGEGQNFRILLSDHCNETTLYIATDISFEGLKLNRSRNKHKNSLYVLCSADKLPFHKEIIEVLLYFGILHHTEMKASSIIEGGKIVKKKGYIILHEVLDRKSFSSFLPNFLKPKKDQSEHEESINKRELLNNLNKLNFKIISSKYGYALFFGLMIKIFRNLMLSKKKFFLRISKIDVFLMNLFGRFIFFFEPGEIKLLAQKN